MCETIYSFKSALQGDAVARRIASITQQRGAPIRSDFEARYRSRQSCITAQVNEAKYIT